MWLEEGVELRGWYTDSVAALRSPSTGVPHFPQNSWSGGTAVAHDGQRLTGFFSPRSRYFIGGFASAIVQRASYEQSDRSMKVVWSALLLEQAGD
jgi:hypothetical protein